MFEENRIFPGYFKVPCGRGGLNIIINGRDFCSDNEIPETWWASVGNYGFFLYSTLKSIWCVKNMMVRTGNFTNGRKWGVESDNKSDSVVSWVLWKVLTPYRTSLDILDRSMDCQRAMTPGNKVFLKFLWVVDKIRIIKTDSTESEGLTVGYAGFAVSGGDS